MTNVRVIQLIQKILNHLLFLIFKKFSIKDNPAKQKEQIQKFIIHSCVNKSNLYAQIHTHAQALFTYIYH